MSNEPEEFVDHSGELFGREPDIRHLMKRAEKKGLTAVTGRPQMGKTWLFHELGRQLIEKTDYLIGYHECRVQSPDLLLRAVSDLYTRWLSEASNWKQAKSFYKRHQQDAITITGQVVGNIFKAVTSLKKDTVIKTGDIVKGALDSLAWVQNDIKTGGLALTKLDYDQARDLIGIISRVSERPVVLILDAWEKSPSLKFEYETLQFFLNHIEEWPLCHIFLGIRQPEHSIEGSKDIAFEYAQNLEASNIYAKCYNLKPMHLGQRNAASRIAMLQHIRNIISCTHTLEDRVLLGLVRAYPGVLQRWRGAVKRGEKLDERILYELSLDAKRYRYCEFDYLLKNLESDHLILAMRLALLPRIDSEGWSVLKKVILLGISNSESILYDLSSNGVLVNEMYPSYGHDTRHEAAKLWFCNQLGYNPLLEREITKLIFELAAYFQESEDKFWPLVSIASFLAQNIKLNFNLGLCALAESAASIAGLVDLNKCMGFAKGWKSALEQDARAISLIANGLAERGISNSKAKGFDKAKSDFNTAIKLPNLTTEQRAIIYFNRAGMLGMTDDPDGAILDYEKVIKTPNIDADLKSRALVCHAVQSGKIGNIEEAMNNLTETINMSEAPTRIKAMAYANRGHAWKENGYTKEAITDFTAIINMTNGSWTKNFYFRVYKECHV